MLDDGPLKLLTFQSGKAGVLFLMFVCTLLQWWWFLPDIQREEKTVQKSIKEAAKRNDMQSAKVISMVFFDVLCDLAVSEMYAKWALSLSKS